MEGAKGLVRHFTAKNITTTFHSKLVSLKHTNGGRLVVAELESVEEFRREASSSILGTTVSEARASAVFEFFVPMDDGWDIDIKESDDLRACVVVAPMIKPTLPVAFRSDELELRSSEGWARWDEQEEMASLLAQITPELNRRAVKNVASARETARKSIKDFVRTWLLESNQWSDDRFSVIEIKFADEVEEEPPNSEVSPQL